MPGFLSEYDATDTLKFGADGQWWVKVKKHLLRGEYGSAQTALVQPIMKYVGTTAETAGDVDTVSYQDVLVFHAVVEWNLTDRDGVLLPLDTDEHKQASIAQLPEDVFEAIVAVIAPAPPKKDAANGKGDGAEDDSFRNRRARRAHGQRAGAAGA